MRRRALLRATLASPLLGGAVAAHAGVPPGYAPVSVPPDQPQGEAGPWHFDLRPAQAQARQRGKALYVYLGATDCPYCRRYEAFLQAHQAELVAAFAARYVFVQLVSQLAVTAARLHLRTEAAQGAYPVFQRALGDERARLLVYPCVWLLGADGRPLMQMPAGTGTFETVAEQLEVLRLEN